MNKISSKRQLSDPLTAFEIWMYELPRPLGELCFFISNYADVLFLGFVLILLFGYLVRKDVKRKHFAINVLPEFFMSLVIIIFNTFAEAVRAQGGNRAIVYVPVVVTAFLFISVMNTIGMVPFGFTVTAQLVPVFTLALVFNIYFFVNSLICKGYKFFLEFMPMDVPIILIPFITIIEIISYLIRTFSLSLRLTANMMAGHILLYILLLFLLIIVLSQVGFLPVGAALFIVCATLVLELLICVVQAYVFAVLLTVYISDVTAIKH